MRREESQRSQEPEITAASAEAAALTAGEREQKGAENVKWRQLRLEK